MLIETCIGHLVTFGQNVLEENEDKKPSTCTFFAFQILVWKYPSLVQVAKLTGHSYRVLYLAMSPDGESIVTGAGDETLRFWNVFSKTRSQKVSWIFPFDSFRWNQT